MAASRALRPRTAALALAGVLAFGLLVAGGRPWAQQAEPETLGVQFHTFTDSRGVTVLSPSGDLTRDFTDRTTLRASFGVDAISAASDSCVRCHSEGAHNARGFAGLTLLKKYGDTKVAVGGEYSKEAFYDAVTANTSITRTLNEANTTVAGGYAFSLNRPMLHPTEDRETQFSHAAYGTLTQTLSKTTIAQVGYELSHITGYQSNPFLRAVVDGVRMVGIHPEVRTRHALTARVRQALPARTYFEADVRRYVDDWDVTANTWSVGLSREMSPRLTLSGIYRRHEQTGASFYQPSYTGQPEFYTADFRIFPFDSNLYTGRVIFKPKDSFMMFPAGTALTAQYEFYSATTKFEAGILTLGVRLPLGHH